MMRMTTFRKILLLILPTLLIVSDAGTVFAGINVWTSNGPEGGRIRALAIDPVTPDTLYAGTEGGGLFKSTNGGEDLGAPSNTGLTASDCFLPPRSTRRCPPHSMQEHPRRRRVQEHGRRR